VDGNIKDLEERNLRDQKVLFERNVFRGKKIYAVVEIIITFIFKPQLHQAKFVVSASKKNLKWVRGSCRLVESDVKCSYLKN
jgi:hypothetical protein